MKTLFESILDTSAPEKTSKVAKNHIEMCEFVTNFIKSNFDSYKKWPATDAGQIYAYHYRYDSIRKDEETLLNQLDFSKSTIAIQKQFVALFDGFTRDVSKYGMYRKVLIDNKGRTSIVTVQLKNNNRQSIVLFKIQYVHDSLTNKNSFHQFDISVGKDYKEYIKDW